MRLSCLPLLLAALVLLALPPEGRAAPATTALDRASVPTSEALEKSLQSLTWPQFRFVVNAVPKLKAKVDAYGKAGWQYVRSHYRTYAWKKSIAKFSPQEKKQLADLIRQAKQQ